MQPAGATTMLYLCAGVCMHQVHTDVEIQMCKPYARKTRDTLIRPCDSIMDMFERMGKQREAKWLRMDFLAGLVGGC